EDHADRAETEHRRPATRLIRVEVADLFDDSAHFRAPVRAPAGMAATCTSAWVCSCGFSCTALSVKSEPDSLLPLVSRMSSEGSANHSEESRLRMYESTRVLDCARP